MIYLEDFIALIYPRICIGCGNPLWKNETIICTFCDYHLPRTDFHLEKENPVNRIFWGRAKIEYASSFLFFNKGNSAQRLVHAIKYHGRKDIGIWIGKQYGKQLNISPFFGNIDCIIPVPLHPGRLLKRGYNQSEQFAIGLCSSMNKPIENNVLFRKKKTESQTKKGRFLRWENVEETFELQNQHRVEGKHILLVDDVITTGATLESCINVFSGIPGVKISLTSIAVADI